MPSVYPSFLITRFPQDYQIWRERERERERECERERELRFTPINVSLIKREKDKEHSSHKKKMSILICIIKCQFPVEDCEHVLFAFECNLI